MIDNSVATSSLFDDHVFWIDSSQSRHCDIEIHKVITHHILTPSTAANAKHLDSFCALPQANECCVTAVRRRRLCRVHCYPKALDARELIHAEVHCIEICQVTERRFLHVLCEPIVGTDCVPKLIEFLARIAFWPQCGVWWEDNLFAAISIAEPGTLAVVIGRWQVQVQELQVVEREQLSDGVLLVKSGLQRDHDAIRR